MTPTEIGLRCTGCGLVRSPAVRAQYTGNFFTDEGYYRSYFSRSAQWEHEARVRLNWLSKHHPPLRLLEIGCAAGFFLKVAREQCGAVYGIEPAEDAARHAREEYGLAVEACLFEDADPPGPFDTLCAWHVLEHVAEPVEFLEHAKRLLDPGGVLAVEVPNIASRSARRQGLAWPHLASQHHVWHFEPSTLSRLLQRVGFAVDVVEEVSPTSYSRLDRQGVRQVRWLRGGDFCRVLARRGTPVSQHGN